jgi:hypothetical protein
MSTMKLEKVMNQSTLIKPLLIAAAIALAMLLTRGSHVLTQISLPDASLALFLLGGLYLSANFKMSMSWFAAFFGLATFIDFGAAAIDPAQGFCLTNGYWGLIPSYAALWFGGLWLSKQANSFSPLRFAMVSLGATFVAFVVSTQTYYLFSGRFPANGMIESIKHGWEYLPDWMSVNAAYFGLVLMVVALVRSVKPAEISKV